MNCVMSNSLLSIVDQLQYPAMVKQMVAVYFCDHSVCSANYVLFSLQIHKQVSM